MNPIVDIRNLEVRKSGVVICQVPELVVARGERVGITGPNGSGKSTLLRVLGGLETEFTGKRHINAAARDRVYVHQSPYLLRGSVADNVRFGLRDASRAERNATVRRWLAELGVEHMSRSSTATVSGGERRRVALARAFATEPALLLLDEPLADLDEAGIDAVCRAIAQSRATILIASPVPLPDELNARGFTLPASG